MSYRYALVLMLLLLMGFASVNVQAATQEGVIYDPQTGNYSIAYGAVDIDGNEFIDEVIFVPATKIAPVVKAKFTKNTGNNSILYSYNIRNRDIAKQAILGLYLPLNSVDTNSQRTPPSWIGTVSTNHVGGGQYVSWTYRRAQNPLAGLAPGTGQSGFGVESRDLPGVVNAELNGATPLIIFAGEIDPASEVGKQVNQLETNNFVLVPAAVPRISVPDPYSATVVLVSLQKHLDTDLVNLKLVDPALVTELDRWLSAAISAADLGNTKALRASLQEARRLLKQEHQDLDKDDDRDEDDKPISTKYRISKLAARVLDFDLRYVESRIKGD